MPSHEVVQSWTLTWKRGSFIAVVGKRFCFEHIILALTLTAESKVFAQTRCTRLHSNRGTFFSRRYV